MYPIYQSHIRIMDGKGLGKSPSTLHNSNIMQTDYYI